MKLPVSPMAYDRHLEQQRSGIIERQFLEMQTLLDRLKINLQAGSGSPESVVAAPIGTLYLRADGGASTSLYVKESGTGTTGWQAK